MKIAISIDGEDIASRIEDTSSFEVIDIENGKICGRYNIRYPRFELNIPFYLNFEDINYIIARKIEKRMDILFKEMGIRGVITRCRKVQKVVHNLERMDNRGIPAALLGRGRKGCREDQDK